MEYLPHIIAGVALLIALFFRSPKEASAEARQELSQIRETITQIWAAHNALAMEHAGNNGRTAAQYQGHEKELARLSTELSGLSREIRTLSDLIRQGNVHGSPGH